MPVRSSSTHAKYISVVCLFYKFCLIDGRISVDPGVQVRRIPWPTDSPTPTGRRCGSVSLRVTKPGGVCLLFTDWRQLPVTSDALQAGGWVWRGLVPWAKTSARPMAGRFTSQCEYVVWGSRGSMGLDFSDACLPGFYQANPPRDREHITQKPLSVRFLDALSDGASPRKEAS